MILLFINIRKVPWEVENLGLRPQFSTFPSATLQLLMNGKSCLIPLLICQILFCHMFTLGMFYLYVISLPSYYLSVNMQLTDLAPPPPPPDPPSSLSSLSRNIT